MNGNINTKLDKQELADNNQELPRPEIISLSFNLQPLFEFYERFVEKGEELPELPPFTERPVYLKGDLNLLQIYLFSREKTIEPLLYCNFISTIYENCSLEIQQAAILHNFISTHITLLQRKMVMQLLDSSVKEYQAAGESSLQEGLRKVNKEILTGALDVATAGFIEALKHMEQDTLLIEGIVLPQNSDLPGNLDESVLIQRAYTRADNLQDLGGTAEELCTEISNRISLGMKILSNLGLQTSSKIDSINITGPSIGATDLMEALGSATAYKPAEITVGTRKAISNKLSFQDKDISILQRPYDIHSSVLGHEIMHALTPDENFGLIFIEGIATLYEIIEAEHRGKDPYTKVLPLLKIRPAKDLNLIQENQKLVDRENSNITKDLVPDRDVYIYPGILLHLIYKKNPKLCGAFLLEVARLRDEKAPINISDILEKLNSEVPEGSNKILPDEINKEARELVARYSGY